MLQPSSVNDDGCIVDFSIRQKFSFRFSTDTVKDNSVVIILLLLLLFNYYLDELFLLLLRLFINCRWYGTINQQYLLLELDFTVVPYYSVTLVLTYIFDYYIWIILQLFHFNSIFTLLHFILLLNLNYIFITSLLWIRILIA